MLTRKPIYPDDNVDCNNRNIHRYSPYIITQDGNLIDMDWWNGLTEYCKDIIKTRNNNNFKIAQITIPHEFQFDNNEKFLSITYRCYIDSFDYNIWYRHLVDNKIPSIPENVVLIRIPNKLKKVFVDMFENREKHSDLLDGLKNEIDRHIDKDKKYFIRMSSTSGKNEKSIKSFNQSCDIISHIASIKLFVDQEFKRDNKDSYLIVIPWNTKIIPRYEFRIFVVNNKLTGISQQNTIELYQYSAKELSILEYAFSNIQFLNNGLYTTYVADVYVDIKTKNCHLIELNPFGAHSGAGAALFNWIDDYNALNGIIDSLPEFRYLSIINY